MYCKDTYGWCGINDLSSAVVPKNTLAWVLFIDRAVGLNRCELRHFFRARPLNVEEPMNAHRNAHKFSALVLAAAVGLLAGCSIGGEGSEGGDDDDGKDHDSTTSASGVSTGTTTGTTTTVAATTYTTTVLAMDAYSATAVSAAVVAPHLGLPSATTTLGGVVTYAYNTAIARAQIDIGSNATTTTTAGGVVYTAGYVPETIDFAPAQGAVLAKTETVNLVRSGVGALPTIPGTATATLTVTPPLNNLGAAATHFFAVANTSTTLAPSRVEFFFTATGTITPVAYIYDYRGSLFAGGAIGVTVPTFLGGVGGALLTFPFATGTSYDVTVVGKDAVGAIIAYSAPVTVVW